VTVGKRNNQRQANSGNRRYNFLEDRDLINRAQNWDPNTKNRENNTTRKYEEKESHYEEKKPKYKEKKAQYKPKEEENGNTSTHEKK
jgi:hypothetical protein